MNNDACPARTIGHRFGEKQQDTPTMTVWMDFAKEIPSTQQESVHVDAGDTRSQSDKQNAPTLTPVQV